MLFEEDLPLRETEGFQREFYGGDGFDLVFSVGTSAMFVYIFEPILIASSRGIPTVEINPLESELSDMATIHLPMRAAEAMREIEKRWNDS